MDIHAFNALPYAQVTEGLRTCLTIPEWIDAVAKNRPYGSPQELVNQATAACFPYTMDQVLAAIEAHPRIGERPVGTGPSARHSASEQAGVLDGGSDLEQIRACNRAYEDRFAMVFIIRAAGRSPQEILAECRRRLTNDPVTELEEQADQLRQIALLRLRQWVT